MRAILYIALITYLDKLTDYALWDAVYKPLTTPVTILKVVHSGLIASEEETFHNLCLYTRYDYLYVMSTF